MLSTCSEFSRMWRLLSDMGAQRVWCEVFYEQDKFVKIYIAGHDTQSMQMEDGTITNLVGTSDITKITKKVKQLFPQVCAIAIAIEFPDAMYREYRAGTVDSPEVVTNLFKKVVSKIHREK